MVIVQADNQSLKWWWVESCKAKIKEGKRSLMQMPQ